MDKEHVIIDTDNEAKLLEAGEQNGTSLGRLSADKSLGAVAIPIPSSQLLEKPTIALSAPNSSPVDMEVWPDALATPSVDGY